MFALATPSSGIRATLGGEWLLPPPSRQGPSMRPPEHQEAPGEPRLWVTAATLSPYVEGACLLVVPHLDLQLSSLTLAEHILVGEAAPASRRGRGAPPRQGGSRWVGAKNGRHQRVGTARTAAVYLKKRILSRASLALLISSRRNTSCASHGHPQWVPCTYRLIGHHSVKGAGEGGRRQRVVAGCGAGGGAARPTLLE